MCRTYKIHEVGQYGVIYCLTSPSGKKYIGQSWDIYSRFWSYKNFSKRIIGQRKIYNALKKYGPENFTFEIIDLCENQTEMDNKEIFYITEIYNSVQYGYNCLSGGSHGKHSKESKIKMSLSHKNKKWSLKQIEGKKNSKYKFIISKSHLTKLHKGRNDAKPGMQDKKQSDFQKITVSKLFKNRKKSESHKNKLSKAKEKYIYEIIDPSGNKYVIFNLHEFCKNNNLNTGNMARVANGYKTNHKHWVVKKLN